VAFVAYNRQGRANTWALDQGWPFLLFQKPMPGVCRCCYSPAEPARRSCS